MYIKIKRMFDFLLSLIALIILSPIFLILAIWIKLDSPGSVFFTQERIGKNKQSFSIYKFRTMYVDAPDNSPSWQLNNPDQYITNVGKIIRRRSIDELPQLINILKGEMSIIGPRPVVWTETELIKSREKYNVFSVLPGLTGWAQINGRDLVSVTEKAYMDGEYIEQQSFLYDVKIFLGTIAYVLKMDDVVEGVMNTVENVEIK